MTIEERIERVLEDIEPLDHDEDCQDAPCEDCQERRAEWWERNMAGY